MILWLTQILATDRFSPSTVHVVGLCLAVDEIIYIYIYIFVYYSVGKVVSVQFKVFNLSKFTFVPSVRTRHIFVLCTHSVVVSQILAVSIRLIRHDIRLLSSFRLSKVPFWDEVQFRRLETDLEIPHIAEPVLLC